VHIDASGFVVGWVEPGKHSVLDPAGDGELVEPQRQREPGAIWGDARLRRRAVIAEESVRGL